MPKTTFQKTRKQIAKKRNGAVDALHEYSRDSKRLHKAIIRDQRMEKLAASRQHKEQPLLRRAAYFQAAVEENEKKAFDGEGLQAQVEKFVHQFDDELAELQKARRPGRPSSVKETTCKTKIEALVSEYNRGFYLPDVTDQENAERLLASDGTWADMSNIQWITILPTGEIKPAIFPPSKNQ